MLSIKLMLVLFLFLGFPSPIVAAGIQPWPVGWSEVINVAAAGIYGQRTAVLWSDDVAVIASIDGRHVGGLSLVVRGWDGEDLLWETVVVDATSVDAPVLIERNDRIELFWIEHAAGKYQINHTWIDTQGRVGIPQELRFSESLMQDLQGVADGERVHLVWVDRTFGQHDVFYAECLGEGLGEVTIISGAGATNARPAVAVLAGDIHAAWISSDGVETNLVHRKTLSGEWADLQFVGPATTSGDESIAFIEEEEAFHLLWTGALPGFPRGILGAQWLPESRTFSAPELAGAGSRLRAISEEETAVVWQTPGTQGFTVQFGLWDSGQLVNVQTLNVRTVTSLRPEISRDEGGHFHVFWIEAHPDGSHQLMTINTLNPRSSSFVRDLGIDDSAPLFHLAFSLLGSVMLSLVYLAMNGLVLVFNVVIQVTLRRIKAYQRLPLFYWVLLTAFGSLLVLNTPLALGGFEFSGLRHVAVSAVAASAMLVFFFGRTTIRSDFEGVILPLLWLFWYQMLMLFPQAMLMG